MHVRMYCFLIEAVIVFPLPKVFLLSGFLTAWLHKNNNKYSGFLQCMYTTHMH